MKTVIIVLFSVLISSINSSDFKTNLSQKKLQVTKKWVIKEAQIGEQVKNKNLQKGNILDIRSNTSYYLNGEKQGSWTFMQGQESIMFINGEFEGMWDIKEMSEDFLEINTVLSGPEDVSSRRVKLTLEAITVNSQISQKK